MIKIKRSWSPGSLLEALFKLLDDLMSIDRQRNICPGIFEFARLAFINVQHGIQVQGS